MSTEQFFDINGKKYSINELRDVAPQQMKTSADKALTAFWTFINDWFDTEQKSIVLRTSGSTGTPKTISLEKEKMKVSALMSIDYFGLKQGLTVLLCISPEYIGGKMLLLRALLSGANLIFKIPSAQPLDDIDFKIDFVSLVPMQMYSLIENSPEKLSFLGKILIGGGAVNDDLEKQIIDKKLDAYHSFGMTETISHFALRKIGSSDGFKCLPGISIDVDESSRLIVNAPMFYNEAILTNDVVELIADNKFVWLGRSDFAFESGGVKIIPEQIESKLSTIIKSRFFLTSVPDDVLNNKAILIIEGDKSDLNFEAIKACIEKYYLPKRVYFLPEFTETPTGKILRKESFKEALALNVSVVFG